MSIIRWSEFGSNVYVYPSEHGYECCGCCMVADGYRAVTRNKEEMARHLEEHRAAGDCVPQVAFERLMSDAL